MLAALLWAPAALSPEQRLAWREAKLAEQQRLAEVAKVVWKEAKRRRRSQRRLRSSELRGTPKHAGLDLPGSRRPPAPPASSA